MNVRVMVVEDELDTRGALVDLLDMLGHEVVAAADGHEALAAFDAFRPDLVLIDLDLPGMTGHELAIALRKRAERRAVRLIALSGWSQAQLVARTYACGMDAHVVKPIGLDALQALLSGERLAPAPDDLDGWSRPRICRAPFALSA